MQISICFNSVYAHTQYTSFHFSSLKISEQRLKEVVEQQGSDVKSIAALVKENEEMLDQMKASYYYVKSNFIVLLSSSLRSANLFSIVVVHSTGKLCSRTSQAGIESRQPQRHED